jgi:hypothetical protein
MIISSCINDRPGVRIDGYRNSEPRHVKLLGIGVAAEDLVRKISDARSGTLQVVDRPRTRSLSVLDDPVDGVKPNAVIVVYQGGDQAPEFPFVIERTASMLSFIVIETEGNGGLRNTQRMRDLRAIADLYVSTSDSEFVVELVQNLAGDASAPAKMGG